MPRLQDKVAIITGASRGQGAAEARRFVAEGARVLVADVADEDGKSLADELGEAAVYHHLDVSSEDEWASAVSAAESAFGRVDVLVNNAGILHFSALAETSLADYERVVRTNQIGTFLGMRAVIPSMGRGASIVNLSSVEGLAGMPFLVSYTASKFAIRGMTKVAAMELGQQGIRVNSVHPGVIDTPMIQDAAGGDMDTSYVGKRVALGRVGQPDEIADLVVFLASDESSYCTGAEFVADGGATATHSLLQT
ncbi:3alpha(or 20beta)-hydroxysteroid dehydrogenase [Halopolyspora algeriensis]|uniref:3alpha(Or 20beta)-hydroxysteroid dehydrogenase n=1 Tax=Halopolyspora algeriensis TaxID=1500506 RepID=A0A368VY76_9ACTN|nr:glucose 1-dehydrogenase [Halopolyspora algeriensis]RCW44534.1 3alpha(or 20beta)-hydroxysteroid dehydrogenase [Halopolyspora algeriensis]TQM55894.1 3alpha(or 20beta)-hydroxysteroid dehydrogenase [Halopolyspora algeriensis]